MTDIQNRFSVTPDLPQGLVLSATEGAISGGPLRRIQRTRYTVLVTNRVGETECDIEIEAQEEPHLCGWEPSHLLLRRHQPMLDNCPLFRQPPAHLPQSPPSVTTRCRVEAQQFSVEPPLPPGLEVHVYTGKVHGTPSQNSFQQLSFLWHTTSSCASPVEDGDAEIIKTRWGTLKSAQVQHMIACRNAVGMNKAAISVAVLDEPDAARVSASQETRHHLHLASQSQAHPQPSFGALESDPLFQTRSLEWAERCSGAKFKSAGGKTGQPNALGSMRLSAQHCTFLVGEVIKPILVLAANGCFVGEDGETGGTGLVFSVQPQLPKGLQIDKLSGMIFGTKSPPGRHLLTCFTHTHTLSHTHSLSLSVSLSLTHTRTHR